MSRSSSGRARLRTEHHSVTAFFAGLGRFVVRFRWPIIALWIGLAIAVGATLPSLGSQVNNNNSAFLPASSPSLKAAQLAAPIIGKETFTNSVLIVAYRDAAPLTAGDQVAISKVASGAQLVPNVQRVVQTATSPSGEATELSVRITINNFGPQQATSMVQRLSALTRQAGAPSGLHFSVAGPLATEVANNNRSNDSARSLSSLSAIFILIILFAIFRSLLAPIVTLFPSVLVLVVAGGIVGGLGEAGLKVSQFTQLLMIVLLLGAGTDYGLFLVFRVREELWAGREPKEAVAVALSRVGESISASAGTVVIALLTLVLASFGIYKDLGVPLAIAIGIMLLAGLTFLPAVLAVLGRAVFWPSNVRAGRARKLWWGRVAGRLVQHPVVTLVAGVAVFGALSIAVTGFRAGGFGGAQTAPKGTDAAQGDAVLARQFPHASQNPTDLVLEFPRPVWSELGVLVSAERVLRSSPLVTTVQGPLDPTGTPVTPGEIDSLHTLLGPARELPPFPDTSMVPSSQYNIYRATSQFISQDGRTVVFAVGLSAGDPQSTAAMHVVPQLRSLVAAAGHSAGASAVGVAGEAAGLFDVSATSSDDLTHIVPLAALAIAALLALVMRSLVAPLYLIASVVLSYLAALGLAVLVFLGIGHDGGLTFLLPFLMFVFLLALGEDYNILVMTRIREEAHDRPLKDAVIRAVGVTGTTVTSAGLVLAGSFAILAISAGSAPDSTQVRAIGFGLAAGILLDTFVVRTVLVPATVALLGRWNWWPSRLSRRQTDLGGLEEAGRDPVVVS